MGRDPLGINQHYFDTKSRNMHYVLGAWYASGSSFEKKYKKQDETVSVYKGVRFHSRVDGLVQIIQRELKSNHKYSSYSAENRKSHWFESHSAPILYERLKDIGLGVARGERKFPTVPEESLSHFVRGLLEAKARIYSSETSTRIELKLNKQFGRSLHYTLKKYAGVLEGGERSDYLVYRTNDVARICRFIYKDMQKKDLCVAHRKELLQKSYL